MSTVGGQEYLLADVVQRERRRNIGSQAETETGAVSTDSAAGLSAVQ